MIHTIYRIKIWLTGLGILGISLIASSQDFTPYPQLNDYIKLGLDSNPGLQKERLQYEMSLEKIKQAGVLPDPTITAGLFVSPVETRVGPQQAKISVSQMFPWFGTLKAQSKQAEYLSASDYFQYLEAANKLVLKIKNIWYEIGFINQKVTVLEEQLQILENLENYMILRFENNKAILSDVLDVQMEKEKLNNTLSDMNVQKSTLTTEFFNELNIKNVQDVVTAQSFQTNTYPEISIDSVYQSNYNLKRLQWQLSATEAALNESKQRTKPSFGVGLDYVIVGERTENSMTDNGKDIIMPMISLQLPIFQKKYKAAVEEKRLQTTMLKQQEVQVKNDIDSQWKKVLNDYAIAKNDMKLATSLLTKVEKSKEIITTAYETGKKTYEDVLRVQHKVFNYQLMHLEANYNLALALAELEYLMSSDLLITDKY